MLTDRLSLDQIVCTAAHQIFPAVNVGVIASKANTKRLWGIDNTHVIAQIIVLAGLVGDFDPAAELAIQFVFDLLKEEKIQGLLRNFR